MMTWRVSCKPAKHDDPVPWPENQVISTYPHPVTGKAWG
jgi:hypothetical protein